MYCSSRKPDREVAQARLQAAQQRWSIIRLVKNSDTEAEQIARKEKLQVNGMLGLIVVSIVLQLLFQERVDEWMSSLCKNMKVKETQRQNIIKFEVADSESKKRSLTKNKKTRLVLDLDQNEAAALKKRIRKREEAEAKRERELILAGKLKHSQSYIKCDKVIEMHEKMQNLELKSRKVSMLKVKKPPVRMKWQNVVQRLHISPPVNKPKIAAEYGDEGGEDDTNEAQSNHKQDLNSILSDTALKIRIENNPVFKSFENARDVDDLYRIAELWVNPCYPE